jgi:hypothetical protein
MSNWTFSQQDNSDEMAFQWKWKLRGLGKVALVYSIPRLEKAFLTYWEVLGQRFIETFLLTFLSTSFIRNIYFMFVCPFRKTTTELFQRLSQTNKERRT